VIALNTFIAFDTHLTCDLGPRYET
jgi:hypothetical protein